MIPSLNQFNRWSYPSKFSFVTFFIGIAVSTAYWLFPDSGKGLIERFTVGPQQTIMVPGNNTIEKQLNLAKMEGVTASIPSSEFAVAIPFARPALTKGPNALPFGANVLGLSNASPLRSENQDIVFAPGKCRFLGTVQWIDQLTLRGEASINSLSCILDNGNHYDLGEFYGPAIGFATPIDQPAMKELQLVEEDKLVTLPRNGKYLVRFFRPLRNLSFKGKSGIIW